MAFPRLDVAEWDLDIFSSHDSVSELSGYSMSIRMGGATIVNPYDHSWRSLVASIPGSSGARNLAERLQTQVPIIVTGQLYTEDANPDDMFVQMYDATTGPIQKLEEIAALPHVWLRLSLWTGAAMVRRRRYVRLLRITQPLVPKTRLTHAQPFQLMFETVDPHWYEDTVQTETIAVVSGAQPKVHAFTTEGGLNDTSRVFITITKDGAGNPSNVSIGDANGKTLVTVGSLTIASEKWEIDCYDGIVKRGTAAWPAGADHMEEMSGDFLTVDKAAETYTISDATPASFNVKVEFIRKLV